MSYPRTVNHTNTDFCFFPLYVIFRALAYPFVFYSPFPRFRTLLGWVLPKSRTESPCVTSQG
jgi:hypothetical protein